MIVKPGVLDNFCFIFFHTDLLTILLQPCGKPHISEPQENCHVLFAPRSCVPVHFTSSLGEWVLKWKINPFGIEFDNGSLCCMKITI